MIADLMIMPLLFFFVGIKNNQQQTKTPTHRGLSETDLGLACPEHCVYSFIKCISYATMCSFTNYRSHLC